MRRKKRSLWLVCVGLSSLLFLLYIIVSFPPNYQFSIKFSIFNPPVGGQILTIYPFFAALFLSIASLCGFLFKNIRRGIFIGLFVVIYLLFRLLRLTHPFYLLILTAIFFTLELFFARRR